MGQAQGKGRLRLPPRPRNRAPLALHACAWSGIAALYSGLFAQEMTCALAHVLGIR